ncbi:MAG: hypothetical protein J5563_07085 [Clostridia bacterium]|nr:hypothetical protein [Clostridia bacterium]
MRKTIALITVLAMALSVLTAISVNAASEPEYVIYEFANYEGAAEASNRTAEDQKKFVQNCDWGKHYSDGEDAIKQLFWVCSPEDAASNPTFTVRLNIAKAGKYHIVLKAFKGGDFGIFDIRLGDETLATGLDFFGDGGLRFWDLGYHQLANGDQDLVFTCKGKNTSSASCNLGISCMTVSTLGYFDMATYLGNTTKTNDTGNVFVQDISKDWKATENPHEVLPQDTNQLFWPVKESAELKFDIDVPESGSYNVTFRCFKGGDFGKFSIKIGDTVVSEETDFFGDGGLTGFDFGEHSLKGGKQTVTITWIGRNDGNTADGANFAISYIYLESVSSAATSDSISTVAVIAVLSLGVIAIIKKTKR